MDKIRPIAVSRRCIKELDIALDSPEWFDWLANQKTFSYRGDSTDMNCVRRSNGRWYANKKIHSDDIGKLKTVSLYVGDDKACTEQKLADINEKFGLGYPGFWKWYYSSARKGDADKGSTQEDKCTPDIELSSQTGEASAKLKSELEQVTQDRDNLLIRLGNLKIQAHEDARVRIEQLEKQNTELDNANWELQKQYTSLDQIAQQRSRQLYELKAENNELKSQLEQAAPTTADLIKQYEATYESIKKIKPPTGVTRNWVEFWRFKTWLESLQNP